MFAQGPSSCGADYLHPHAHALAFGAKLNPVQGSGQMELPGIFESHIQAPSRDSPQGGLSGVTVGAPSRLFQANSPAAPTPCLPHTCNATVPRPLR